VKDMQTIEKYCVGLLLFHLGERKIMRGSDMKFVIFSRVCFIFAWRVTSGKKTRPIQKICVGLVFLYYWSSDG